ncbi:hypothetical protein NDU88_004829 [Pleurodeles waltl]|uniref:Secreted protein n=1 Tax=Pleurodeles waltl TaxID=8319 RepID=A0AAV7W8Z5_PLEWA|nr:hypothetical protein NDU88_004829 [Pleurodeles waltl]
MCPLSNALIVLLQHLRVNPGRSEAVCCRSVYKRRKPGRKPPIGSLSVRTHGHEKRTASSQSRAKVRLLACSRSTPVVRDNNEQQN